MNNARFTEMVTFYENQQNKKGEKVKINHLLVYQKGDYQTHAFNNKDLNDIRSISKTVMTLLFGRICMLYNENGKTLSEETFVYPIIKEAINRTNEENLEQLKKIQVKHLLTHTIGYDDVLLMRGDIKDKDPYSYVDYLVNHPIVHQPGEYYLYSNAGFYLLSVFLQELMGRDLLEVADEVLFSKLEVKEYRWAKYGNYLAGATRLWLYPEDLLKMGQLLLNKGSYRGEQLIAEEWIDKMIIITNHTPDVDNSNFKFRRFGYGYGIWLAKDSFYFGHGTDGQILAILPDEELIVVTLSNEHDLLSIEEGVEKIIRRARE